MDMKPLSSYMMESVGIHESKIKSIHDEIRFWEDPQNEKLIAKKSGVIVEFVRDAMIYLAQITKDTLKFEADVDWSLQDTINYLKVDFVDTFTCEPWVWKKWSNGTDYDIEKMSKQFADTAIELLRK